MTTDVFLDTNVLVYAFIARSADPPDPRTQVAQNLLMRGGKISVQVLNEFGDVAARKFQISWAVISEMMSAVRVLCGEVISLSEQTTGSAIAFSQRHRFRLHDSLILASAVEAGCSILLTEDLQHGQTIEGIRIENPFRTLSPVS
jgi:predicted nucleic acid-binding protein